MYTHGNSAMRERTGQRKKKGSRGRLRNVISLRINDAEKMRLEHLMQATSKSISTIMREAMEQWADARSGLCTE